MFHHVSYIYCQLTHSIKFSLDKWHHLRQQLTKLFTKYKVDLSRRANFEKEIQQQFIRSFSRPIPTELEARSLDEKQLIQSIQYH